MFRIVMFEPTRQLSHYGLCIRPMGKIGIVALECSNAALGHPITLRASQPRCHRLQSQFLGKRARLRRRVAAAVIGQPLKIASRLAVGTEARFDRLHHQVTDQVCIDGLARGYPTHRFPITVIKRKGHPNPLTVIAAKLEPIRAPAGIAGIDRNSAIVSTTRYRFVAPAMQQQLVIPHDSVNTLMVCPSTVQPQHRPHTSIAIVGTISGNIFDRPPAIPHRRAVAAPCADPANPLVDSAVPSHDCALHQGLSTRLLLLVPG